MGPILAIAISVFIGYCCAPSLDLYTKTSHVLYAKDGQILSYTLSYDDKIRFKTTVDDVDPIYLNMLLASEDERFYSHLGVDPIAIVRSLFTNLRQGEVVTGASTIAMQVCRLLEPKPRTWWSKIKEGFGAIYLTLAYGRETLLNIYLTKAPFGANIEGVKAASLTYFKHLPKRLSPAEASFLVALPRSPEIMRIDREVNLKRAINYRNLVLDEALKSNILSKDLVTLAKKAPLPTRMHKIKQQAFHFLQRAIAKEPYTFEHYSNLESKVQSTLNVIAKDFKQSSNPKEELAVVVIDNDSHQLVGYLGSKDYIDTQYDLTQAIRSPGSALKPFAYTLAFEKQILHPKTIINDVKQNFFHYAPQNFYKTFKGQIEAQQALVLSLNIPAVMIMQRLGPQFFVDRLNSVKYQLVLNDIKANLPVILGGVGINLFNLTNLYAALANDGEYYTVKELKGESCVKYKLFDSNSARATYDILQNHQRNQVLTHKVSYKTGTSYGYRDALSIGSLGHLTVGVWVGKLDNSPNLFATGETKATPILFKLFSALEVKVKEKSCLPAIGALSSMAPMSLKYFNHFENYGLKTDELTISYPHNGDRIKKGFAPFVFVQIIGGVPPYELYLDGVKQEYLDKLDINERGFYDLMVLDSSGSIASSQFFLE